MDRVTDSYVSLFLNSSFAQGQGDFLAPLSLFFLFLARFLPIIGLSPFFGARIMPNPVKVGFAIAMFAIFLPKLLFTVTTPIKFNLLLALLMPFFDRANNRNAHRSSARSFQLNGE